MPSLPQHRGEQPTMIKMKKTQPRAKMLIYLALALGISWTVYIMLSRSVVEWGSEDVLLGGENPEAGQYGLNERPIFIDTIQVLDLPSKHIPETGKNRHPGRLVIVGDVHGMKNELVNLLEKVDFDKDKDHLILAGDMISKGPDSPGVVDLAMSLGATGVRGNHEDRIILAQADMVADHLTSDLPGPNEGREKVEDALEEESFSHGDYKDRSLVRLLGPERMKWLKGCPVILRVGKIGDMGEVVVVHAGLTPSVELEKQNPAMVMNMRTMSKDGVPSDEGTGTVWMKVCKLAASGLVEWLLMALQVWNKYQNKLPKNERTTVIYGHNAKLGLQVEKYSIGLDTGCVKGGRLTALVIEGGNTDHTTKLVHVDCADGRTKWRKYM
jgi:hypothetical protein